MRGSQWLLPHLIFECGNLLKASYQTRRTESKVSDTPWVHDKMGIRLQAQI